MYMKSLIKTIIRSKESKESIAITHSVKTFKEYFYYNNTNQGTNSQFEINNILGNLKNEITLFTLSIHELFINNPKLTIYIYEDQFSLLFASFKQKLLNDLDYNQLHNWLSLNIQPNYQSTIELLKIHIKNQLEKLVTTTNIWVDTFYEDYIFKYSLIDYDSQKLCIDKTSKFTYSLCYNLLQNSYFDGIEISISKRLVTICYQTIFQSYPNDLSFLPYTEKFKLRNTLQMRIYSQSRINLSVDTQNASIKNLIDFYKLILNDIAQLPKPLKMKLKTIDSIKDFKIISDYFIRKWKVLNCSLKEFLDIVDEKSNEGYIFNVEEEKKTLFFFFIDILTKVCISNHGILEVIKDRFIFNNEAYLYNTNSLSKVKSRNIIEKLNIKDKEEIEKYLKYKSYLH